MQHKDPYKIWLYEIIMQQTRISQGLPYYEKFVKQYPSVYKLADAAIDDVLKLWEGLGYYSRARNLHEAAKQICEAHGGKFPSSSKELQKLKGIGSYTSAAIATFANNEKIGVVDGNVYRVLSRIFGLSDPIDQTQGKKMFFALAQDLVDEKKPAIYNQAIMDFGALQCTPKVSSCKKCSMVKSCYAFNNDAIASLPVKSKKLKKRIRYFNFIVIEYKDQVILRQRREKDIWKLLYEYPYLETEKMTTLTKSKINRMVKDAFNYTQTYKWNNEQKVYKQQLTHQTIIGSFYKVTLNAKPNPQDPYVLAKKDQVGIYAFPKIIDCYLNDISISLFK